MKEIEIQRSILDYLEKKRIFHYRNNSGGFRDINNHFYRFGALGSPDIICVVDGKYIGLEVKTKKGQQSEHQKDFQKKLEKAGGEYYVVRSIDDVMKIL